MAVAERAEQRLSEARRIVEEALQKLRELEGRETERETGQADKGSEDELLAEAGIRGAAQQTVLDERMLTSSEVARRLGSTATNPRELARQLRERSELLGVPGRRGYLFPDFQVDAERLAIHPEVAETNRILDAANDPWGVASWWVSVDARLGSRPMDLVATDRAGDIVAAARGLVEAVG